MHKDPPLQPSHSEEPGTIENLSDLAVSEGCVQSCLPQVYPLKNTNFYRLSVPLQSEQVLHGCAFTRSRNPLRPAGYRLSLLGAEQGTALIFVTVTLGLSSVNKQIVSVRCCHGKTAHKNGWYGCALFKHITLCILTLVFFFTGKASLFM